MRHDRLQHALLNNILITLSNVTAVIAMTGLSMTCFAQLMKLQLHTAVPLDKLGKLADSSTYYVVGMLCQQVPVG